MTNIDLLAGKLRDLMAKDERLEFQYAEVAATADTEDDLRQVADAAGWFDTGNSFGTLKQYRAIGLAWRSPDGTFAWHPDVKWTTHAELASGPALVGWTAAQRRDVLNDNPKMTKRQARVFAGKKAMKDDVSQPAAAVASILEDQAAVDDIASNPAALEALRRAMVAVEDQVAADQSSEVKAKAKNLSDLSDSMKVVTEWQRVLRLAGKALRMQMDLGVDEAGAERVRSIHRALADVMEWSDESLDSGGESFEDALAALLSDNA